MRWIFFKETMIKINIKIIIRLNRIRREEISRGRYCTVLFKKNGRMREMEFFERQGKNGQTEGVNARYIAERASLTGLTKGKRY